MIHLLPGNRANIDSLSVPDFDWEQTRDEKDVKQWVNPEQTIALSTNFFKGKPDIPTTEDINALRAYYRGQIIGQKGGLIQTDLTEIKGHTIIKTIFKFPQSPSGTTYLSSLTIPFAKYSFVVKIQAMEAGHTGVRDNMIANKLLRQGKISTDEAGNFKGWSSDPYLKGFKEGNLMNLSENQTYDNQFRMHPLSLSRNMLAKIEDEIAFSDSLKKLKPFG
ncbi:MAG: hypothetical protein HEP71_34670 [Roseivirga sp.]|nr:hypothetical protein [Roseivirga sp.]